MNNRLYRSPDDRVIAGVAGGMAETYDLDPALVRIGWALLILLTGGVFLLLYIIMALVVPLRPAGMPLWSSPSATPDPAGSPGTDLPPDQGGPPPGPGEMPGASTAEGTTGGAPTAGAAPPPGSYGYHYSRHPRRRDGSAALVFGLILILVGGYFLLREYVPAIDLNLFWPLIIIIGGVLLIVAAFSRPRSRP